MTTIGATVGAGLVRETAACSHCALPVPRGLIEANEQHQFCCEGCRTVFGIVQGHGLDRYYELRRELEASRVRAEPVSLSFEEFDDPAFAELYAKENPDGSVSAKLLLEGVHCAACVWLIERLGRVVPGVSQCTLNFGRSTVAVRYDPQRTSLACVARGLNALGYRPHPPRGAARDELRASESRKQLVRLGVAGALAGNTMLLAIALYAGMLDGITEPTRQALRVYSAALGLVALAWPGRVFLIGALGALRARTPHLDIPIAMALLVGGVWGTVNTVRGTGEIYFDSLTALVFLLLVGRFLQHRQQRRAADSLELLFTLTPTSFRHVEDGTVVTRPIGAAKAGDVAEVLAGETIPADGVVVLGESSVDNSMLTGESTPTMTSPGRGVLAGALNLRSTIRVQIEATGEQTRVGQLMALVAEASARKPGAVQLADRLAGWFVIVVAVLATGTAVVWWLIDPSKAIEHATALLIVTCPCALGLATPLVFTASLGRLAHRGVLIKGGASLERLAHAGRIFVDKTGTLTTGTLRVSEWTGPEEVRLRVAALERFSTHPIAAALRECAGSEEPGEAKQFTVERAEQHDGLGIVGLVGSQRLTVGSRVLMEAESIDLPERFTQWARERAEQGQTPVFVAENGLVVAAAAVTGDLRSESRAFIGRLDALGVPVAMLTGDREDAAWAVADRVGLTRSRVIAEVSPEGKVARVENERSGMTDGESVVMVGDGVNDAGALAAADVGIAVAGGAEASLQAADVYIKDRSLLAVPMTMEAARWTLGRVRLCLAVSLVYNAVGAALAMLGLIHPLLAAVLMPISSLTVLGLATMKPSWVGRWAKMMESEKSIRDGSRTCR